MFFLSIILLFFTACSNETVEEPEAVENKSEEEQEEVEQEEVEQAENEEEAGEGEVVEEGLIAFNERTFTKRNLPLVENDSGKLIFVGEENLGDSFSFALKREGDVIHADNAKLYMRFIFERSESLTIDTQNPEYITETRLYNDEEYWIYTINEYIGDQKLLRIDYSFVDDEWNEEAMETILVEDTTETYTIEPLHQTTKLENPDIYRTSETSHMASFFFNDKNPYPNKVFEDEEKTIKLNLISYVFDDELGHNFRLSMDVTYKEDGLKTFDTSIFRPATQTLIKGDMSLDKTEVFAGIPVQMSYTFEVTEPFGDDEGSEVFFFIDDFLLSLDLRTGEVVEKPHKIFSGMLADRKSCFLPIPYEGVKMHQGETVYNALMTRKSCYNEGSGKTEKTHFAIPLGGEYETFSFKLASSEEYASYGGEMDFYVYGDDYKTDSANPLLHHKIKGTDAPKEFTVDVSDLNTLNVYIDHNRIDHVYGDKLNNFMELLIVEPTLK